MQNSSRFNIPAQSPKVVPVETITGGTAFLLTLCFPDMDDVTKFMVWLNSEADE